MNGKRSRAGAGTNRSRTVRADGQDADQRKRWPPSNCDDRGQMLLAGAVVMGFMLVVLVLVLNSLLFAQNVESGGVQSDSPGADTVNALVETELGVMMVTVNDVEGPDVEDNFSSTVHNTTTHWEKQEFTIDGASANVTVDGSSIVTGERVRQTNGSTFTSTGGASDWELATNVSGVRRFQFDVETDSLFDLNGEIGSPSEGDPLNHSILGTNTFYVEIGASADDWRVYLFEFDGDLVVATGREGDDAVVRYVGDVSSATVDVTTGSVDEEQTGTEDRTDLFEFADGQSGPYAIEYENGDQAEGNYTMTLNGALIDTTNLNSGGPSPYYTEAVYSAQADLSYATKRIGSESTIVVAPCTTDQLRCESYGVTDPW